jgi:hypothetical protein
VRIAMIGQNACLPNVGPPRQLEQVHAHRDGVETHGLLDGMREMMAEEVAVEGVAIDVGDIGTQHQRGLSRPGRPCSRRAWPSVN